MQDSLYRFGSFDLDGNSGELRKLGYRIPLQDQPARILKVLVANPEKLVTREELRAELWPADTFVDFDRSLNKAMVKLRQALDDDAETPRFIETLPKRGYRFLMPVEIVSTAAAMDTDKKIDKPAGLADRDRKSGAGELIEVPAETPAKIPVDDSRSTEKRINRKRVGTWAVRASAVVACVGILLVVLPKGWREKLLPGYFHDPIRTLAVLPLRNFSADASQDYFVDGMTDELTTSLARIENLRVTSRTTMERYRKTEKTLPEIARELNVDAMIEGSVTRSGDNVRITIQLIDARVDHHLWAQSYQRQITDILQVQDAIASDVATQVEKSIETDEGHTLGVAFARSAPKVKPDAFDNYLRGKSELSKQNPIAIKKAADYFQAAIDEDPSYAQGYGALAEAYNLMANYQVMSAREAYPQARVAAQKALDLDPTLPQPHIVLASVKHHYEWDWAGAEQEYKLGLDLQPTNAVSHARYAWFLSDMGRHEEAIAELRRAQALDPQSIVIVNNLGRSLYLARRYDEAIVELQRAIEMAPDRLFNHVFLGMAYDAKQMCPEALNEFHIAQSLLASMDESGTVHAYATCGRTEDARKAVALLAGPRTESVRDWMYIGGVYAALGDKERAFEWLDKAVHNRDIFLTEVKVHPYMDPLRSDVRYARLLDSMKFPP